jgi:hypothetical protein
MFGYYRAGGWKINREVGMDAYSPNLERMMQRLYSSLGEKGRRRYAAVEAAKFGHGGIDYVAQVLGCDPKTIGQGQAELEGTENLNGDRERKKGVDASHSR